MSAVCGCCSLVLTVLDCNTIGSRLIFCLDRLIAPLNMTTKTLSKCILKSNWTQNQRTHFLFGVSAKHLSEDVSTTVSQKLTTGSATLISKEEKSTIINSLTEITYCTSNPLQASKCYMEIHMNVLRHLHRNFSDFENVSSSLNIISVMLIELNKSLTLPYKCNNHSFYTISSILCMNFYGYVL